MSAQAPARQWWPHNKNRRREDKTPVISKGAEKGAWFHNGFWSKKSCETQLISMIHNLAKGLSEGKQIDIILLDFTKVFNKVPHQRLLYKMNYYGIHGPVLSWIESFLHHRMFLWMAQHQKKRKSCLGCPRLSHGPPIIPGLPPPIQASQTVDSYRCEIQNLDPATYI